MLVIWFTRGFTKARATSKYAQRSWLEAPSRYAPLGHIFGPQSWIFLVAWIPSVCFPLLLPTSVGNSLIGFSNESLVFVSERANHSRRSFFMSYGSASLTVALLWRATGVLTHCRSIVKSGKSESLPSLFTKERLSEERWERFALGHKKGEKQWKTVNTKILQTFQRIACFWERFARIKSKSLILLFC